MLTQTFVQIEREEKLFTSVLIFMGVLVVLRVKIAI